MKQRRTALYEIETKSEYHIFKYHTYVITQEFIGKSETSSKVKTKNNCLSSPQFFIYFLPQG